MNRARASQKPSCQLRLDGCSTDINSSSDNSHHEIKRKICAGEVSRPAPVKGAVGEGTRLPWG